MLKLIKRAVVIQDLIDNYLIYYQLQEDIIDIMHVFQGSQNIESILQQESAE
jgi:plasmid stabilization system protein ParE